MINFVGRISSGHHIVVIYIVVNSIHPRFHFTAVSTLLLISLISKSIVSGAFRLYDVDNDGFITRDEMYNIVDAIYQMVVSTKMYYNKLQGSIIISPELLRKIILLYTLLTILFLSQKLCRKFTIIPLKKNLN